MCLASMTLISWFLGPSILGAMSGEKEEDRETERETREIMIMTASECRPKLLSFENKEGAN